LNPNLISFPLSSFDDVRATMQPRRSLNKGTMLLTNTRFNALLFSRYKSHLSPPRFFASRSIPSAAGGKLWAGSLLLFGCAALSDPFLSAIESSKRDVNVSYWKTLSEESDDEVTLNESKVQDGCRLRNISTASDIIVSGKNNTTATTAADKKSLHSPPEYARIVIVGGGMAGLHTALCLAERMNNNLPGHGLGAKNPRSIFWRQPKSVTLEKVYGGDIVVFEADTIGNGASGRAKGASLRIVSFKL
jgi:hypothetical protein